MAKFKTRLSTENYSYDSSACYSLTIDLGAYFLATSATDFLAFGWAGFFTAVLGVYFLIDLAGEWVEIGLDKASFLV